jgi:predicted nuclease of restriction endonuclease-like (RecB) superfamily
MTDPSLIPADYAQLLAEVKKRVRSAHYAALKAVNTELVGLYWDLGRMIVERQEQAGWGKSVVERLSQDLRREFSGVAGFSVQNLWYMRQFHMEYRGNERLQPLVGEVAWAHNLVIMSKCKSPLERELERALIARVEDFLRAMGGVFAFMGSQYRLEVDGREFFLDLLLFHRRLRSLVAIDLKIGDFQPEFVGKMQFYLTALDRQVRQEDENPSIGIILCKEKNRTIVEYALHDATKPIGVATYQITKILPKEFKGQLPKPEEIAALLDGLVP